MRNLLLAPVVAAATLAAVESAPQSASAVQVSATPIRIASLTHRWVPIDSHGPTEFPGGGRTPGLAMLSDNFEISYEKAAYRGKKVKLVAEVDSADANRRLVTHIASVEREVPQPTGKLWVAWAASGKSMEGRGIMRIYLAENKKNGKPVSNVITLPAAGGRTAQAQLTAELGSRWLHEPGK